MSDWRDPYNGVAAGVPFGVECLGGPMDGFVQPCRWSDPTSTPGKDYKNGAVAECDIRGHTYLFWLRRGVYVLTTRGLYEQHAKNAQRNGEAA